MIIERKRYRGFETRRIRKTGEIAIIYTRLEEPLSSPRRGPWRITGRGRGACSLGDGFLESSYPISFRKLPPDKREAVREAVAYIVERGDPIANDQSVYD